MVIADGLLKSAGQRLALSDWSESGNPINDVSAASAALAQAGVFGPYTLVLSTALFAMLQRPFRHSGQLESKLVQAIADGGIFQSPAITGNQALLVAQGAQYMDLAVAQDLTTAYLGPEGMDHRFRVLESLVLRVKQPAAVCVIE